MFLFPVSLSPLSILLEYEAILDIYASHSFDVSVSFFFFFEFFEFDCVSWNFSLN